MHLLCPSRGGEIYSSRSFYYAVEIAQGSRRAIGVTSIAFLYRNLDNVHHYVAARKASASDCSLFVPGHFIMAGLLLSRAEVQRTASPACSDLPYIVNFRDYRSMDFKSAHELFWDFNQDGTGLCSLDFLGRSGIRFPNINQEFDLFDNIGLHVQWVISKAAVVDQGVRKGTTEQQQKKIAKHVSIPPEHREKSVQDEIKTTSPSHAVSPKPTEVVKTGPDRSGERHREN
uniref:Uncharacterized protein n=1 Tax=Oryza punctata TaxID=4537 RepID=A0A0E0KEV5_ORYPU